MEINRYIDHTNLKATSKEADIKKLCMEAKKYKFATVCINPSFVKLAKKELADSNVKICTVIGFPLGANSIETKVFEIEDSIKNGADEVDVVINISKLKDNRIDYIKDEIERVREASSGKILKLIIETCYLEDSEKELVSKLGAELGADYIKTSTGFGSGGATLEDIKIMKKAVAGKAKLKASGGIRNREDAMAYIELGVDRIGTSGGVAIVSGEGDIKGY